MIISRLVEAVGTFFTLAIFARVIFSWFPAQTNSVLFRFVFAVTEPILAPIRRFLPRTWMLDFSPMIALVIIIIIQQVLLKALA